VAGYTQPRADHAAILVRQADGDTWTPDAVLKVEIAPDWSTTDHPVESDAPVTDHIQRQPGSITVSCVVTENPLRAGSVIGGPQRLREKLSWLYDTANAKQLVDIVTKLGTFTNYAIRGLPHTIDNVSRLQFDLGLREIRVATSETISVETLASDVAAGAAPVTNSGTQATTSTTTDPVAEAQDQSTLAGILDWLGT
jgi:hypothetical protein